MKGLIKPIKALGRESCYQKAKSEHLIIIILYTFQAKYDRRVYVTFQPKAWRDYVM